MHSRTRSTAMRLRAGLGATLAVCCLAAPAQALDLRQAYEAAWARQPEAQALQARRDATRAQQQAAQAWTPQPAALELSSKTDRLTGNGGARELEVGIAVPLWLPGERSRSAALAHAESAAVESRALAAQLRVAATVREAWWQWQRARIEVASARDQVDNTRRLAADVARRTQAGDLARADQHQAEGAVAGAEATLALTEAGLAAAQQHLRGLAGEAPTGAATAEVQPEPEPDAAAADADTDAHATLQELQSRAAVAGHTVALSAAQSRAHPELLLATTRDRGARGDASQQTLTLALRIPFGGGPRVETRTASARAEATEIQAQLALERHRLMAEREAARNRVQAVRMQLTATERRAQLARETRGFFDKSFKLGETDLPTRLRVEAEAAEADRQVARIRIEAAAAVSAWRQALGLLPQ